jgi:hypothetical protein
MNAGLDACTRCHGTGLEPGLIPLPGLEPARLKSVRRDGEIVWKLRCPECHQWADIDDDQLHGRVSIDHRNNSEPYDNRPVCTFHQTIDLHTLMRSLL